MKNSILIFLLGVFVTISIAAGTSSTGLLTVKPATPKKTICFIMADDNNLLVKINYYLKQGYIVSKLGTLPNYTQTIVIMEKY